MLGSIFTQSDAGLGGRARLHMAFQSVNTTGALAQNHVRGWSRSAAGMKQVNRCAVFMPAALRPQDADDFIRQHRGRVPRRRAATGDPRRTAFGRAARYAPARWDADSASYCTEA